MATNTRSLALALALALGCAPIETEVTHTEQPRSGPVLHMGEQLVDRHFVADYVQLDARVMVEIHELCVCSSPRHVPVMRIEQVERTSNGFVAWDWGLGAFSAGFAVFAFAYPKPFSRRLYGSEGQLVYDTTPAYVVGGVFAGIAAILIAAGVVNSIKATDETRYAEAYRVEAGPQTDCSDAAERALAVRDVELIVGDRALVVPGTTDERGRVRFELPGEWPAGVDTPQGPFVPAVIGVAGEGRVIVLDLRFPWAGMVDAHSGRADTREGRMEGPQARNPEVPDSESMESELSDYPDSTEAESTPPVGFGGNTNNR